MKKSVISWILSAGVAFIFLQTLFFKFTAHPDSVHIFSELGVEPYGRIGLGVIEMITAVLILVPRTRLFGIFISLGIIGGAIFSHLLVIGFSVNEDGGNLFILAIIVLVLSSCLLILHRSEIHPLLKRIKS